MNHDVSCCPKELGDKLSPLVQHLLSMDSRIRVYEFFGDVEETKGFFVTRRYIYIPYVLPLVEHDIAHLLELTNSRRWTLPDWGMPRFNDEDISSKRLFAALSRECRTRAIQMHMVSFKSEADKLKSTSWSLLNNSYWEGMVKKLLPFGRFKTYQDVEIWHANLRERTMNAWNRDRILHEWKIRLNHIQNYMETA